MMKNITSVQKKDLICTQEWSLDDLSSVIHLAYALKHRKVSRTENYLKGRTFLMLFYNPSVRTRISFEAACVQLGGRAIFMEPRLMRLKDSGDLGETVEDVSRVASKYVSGIGVRILEDQIKWYGQGDEIIREYAKYSSVPVISLAHDKFHPCQGLADIMGWAEWLAGNKRRDRIALRNLKGKKLLLTWARGKMARSWGSVQEALLIGSRFRMDITLAYPEGYDLDPNVIESVRANCSRNDQSFKITHDPVDGYKDANIVYSRNWLSPTAYASGRLDSTKEINDSERYIAWTCTADKMKLTNDGFFTHPMPIDRNREVEDSVASGPRSCIYDVAENRLHVEKALLMTLMGP